jgi:3-hydroxybutyryl-CoA dehydrogenase
VTRLAIIGAGLMGSGIAQVAAQAGYDVTLRDVDDAPLKRAKDSIAASYARVVKKGTLADADADAALARIVTTTDLEAVADADVVVEAIFENLQAKHDVFRVLDRICGAEAVLATNTSALPITEIAAATSRPESVVGTHFFSPVPMMKLCELVRGHRTSDATVAKARSFAEDIGKTCTVVNRDVAGFVTTRLIVALCMEAAKLVESGVATSEDVDTACKLGFGHAMGPMATMDLTGIDIMVNAARNVYTDSQDSKFFPPETLIRMVTAGDLGRKSGRGWYRYDS